MQVFVLLLNTGSGGIHTLKVGGTNVILMFEEEDDATRYAMMLEAQDFPALSVEEIEDEEIIEFCQDSGYQHKLVSHKDLVVPPERNIEADQWELKRESSQESSQPKETKDGEFSTSELDQLRKQLENLL